MTWYVPLPLVGDPRLKYNDPGRDCCWEGEVYQVMTFKKPPICFLRHFNILIDFGSQNIVQLHCDTVWLSKTFSGHLKNMWVRFKLLPDLWSYVDFPWSFHRFLDFHFERLPQIAMNDPLFGGVIFFGNRIHQKTTNDDASTSLALISCNCGL